MTSRTVRGLLHIAFGGVLAPCPRDARVLAVVADRVQLRLRDVHQQSSEEVHGLEGGLGATESSPRLSPIENGTNRVPQMGKLAPNTIYSQGYSGHAVNVIHFAGSILADTVCGTFERFDVFATIKPSWIPGQHLFRNPIVVLGMIYYKLVDRLSRTCRYIFLLTWNWHNITNNGKL